MDLQEFISNSLVQIANGISKAQEELKETSTKINPKMKSDTLRATDIKIIDIDHDPVAVIDFDIALTVEDKEKKSGKIGLLVASFGAGASINDSYINTSISRIKFSILAKLPTTK